MCGAFSKVEKFGLRLNRFLVSAESRVDVPDMLLRLAVTQRGQRKIYVPVSEIDRYFSDPTFL